MPNFLRRRVPLLLLLSCFFFCNISSQKNEEKNLEVPPNDSIVLNDGRQHYYHFSSQFITNHPLVDVGSPEQSPMFLVSVMDTYVHMNEFCKESISITAPHMAPRVLCYGMNERSVFLIPENFTIDFKGAKLKPTEVHVIRFFRPKDGVCRNETDYRCGFMCYWKEVICDGQKHCVDGSDEKDCFTTGTTSSSTSDWNKTTSDVISTVISTTPAESSRRCDLPGASWDHKPESSFKKRWSVAVYSTGIIIVTAVFSLAIGFCCMQPSLDENDDEEEEGRTEENEDGDRRLDPQFDHPPSYEDVMNMDLSATIHQRPTVPKEETPVESP